MSGRGSVTDNPVTRIRGEAVGMSVLGSIERGTAAPDALGLAALSLRAEPAALLGLLRAVQKHLERAVASGRAGQS